MSLLNSSRIPARTKVVWDWSIENMQKKHFFLTKSGAKIASTMSDTPGITLLRKVFEIHSICEIMDSCTIMISHLKQENLKRIRDIQIYILQHLCTLLETFILCGWIKVCTIDDKDIVERRCITKCD